jgi:hypothetical protein
MDLGVEFSACDALEARPRERRALKGSSKMEDCSFIVDLGFLPRREEKEEG